VDTVIPKFGTGLKAAATRLHQLGHRRFAFLAARSKGQRVGGRPAYFQKVIQEFSDSHAEIVDCGPNVIEAREVGRNILEASNRPTAVVALNDLTAIGVMRAAKDLGLEVPGDISVVGIDGIPLAEQMLVSLSTVAQPHDAMVAKAVEFLLSRIEGEESIAPRRAEFDTEFIERESIGPVR
jgi:LacI family transcriptional regulator